MAKSIEEDLADYLLSLQRGGWTAAYNRACLKLWRETYGDRVAERVEAIVRQRWKK